MGASVAVLLLWSLISAKPRNWVLLLLAGAVWGGLVWSRHSSELGSTEDRRQARSVFFVFSYPPRSLDSAQAPVSLLSPLSGTQPRPSALPEAASRMREFTVQSAGRPVGRGRHGAGPEYGSSCAPLPPVPAQHTAFPAPTGGLWGKQQGTFPISEPQTCLLQGAWRETQRKTISSQQDS